MGEMAVVVLGTKKGLELIAARQEGRDRSGNWVRKRLRNWAFRAKSNNF
jgi:hypothetical protein